MRASRSAWIPIALLLGGCAVTKEAAFIDISRVAASDVSRLPRPVEVMPQKPERFPGGSAATSALPPRTITFPEMQGLVARAREQYDLSQRQAFAALRENLVEAYSIRARIEADTYRHGAQIDTSELLAEAVAELERAFQEYAEGRAHLLTRLAFLESRRRLRPEQQEELELLRKQLADADAAFDKTAQSILSRLDIVREEHQREVETEVRRILQSFRNRAEEDARRFTRDASVEIQSELASRGPVELPATPGASVEAPGSSPVPDMPEIGVVGDPNRIQRIEHDLEIWLGITGRERSTVKGVGRDLTEEFIEWRRKHRDGR